MSDHLDGFRVVIEWPVSWGDLDAFQHVNNTVYFRWFEHGRLEYFHRVGFTESMERDRIGPILAHTECRFRRALTYPDRVTIGTRVRDLEATGFIMEYRVVSERLNDLAATGTGRIVTLNYDTHEKAPIPAAVRAAIVALDGGN